MAKQNKTTDEVKAQEAAIKDLMKELNIEVLDLSIPEVDDEDDWFE
jgi:hypothetical protein